MEEYLKFIEAVQEMRKNQKMYFKSREYSDLDKSKKSERQVDLMLVNFNLKKTGWESPKELAELPTLVGTMKQEAPMPLGSE
jgi:hypothetical protein